MSKQARTRRGASPGYSFAFEGFREDWYVLQADMKVRSGGMDALAFEGKVMTWLIDQGITPGTWAHLGSGNTGDYPLVPNEDGSKLCLLLKRPADVLRLCGAFPCTGVTMETLHAAVQAEARVHRFVLDDVVRVAHDAVRRLYLTFGDTYPTWEEMGGETRVAFKIQVKQIVERPEQTPEAIHAAWVERRQKDGWRLGGEFSEAQLRDPSLLPWRNLPPRVRARYELLKSVVSGLSTLLQGGTST